jgi:hypothetical protein
MIGIEFRIPVFDPVLQPIGHALAAEFAAAEEAAQAELHWRLPTADSDVRWFTDGPGDRGKPPAAAEEAEPDEDADDIGPVDYLAKKAS